jgi:hypothetical protein
VSAAELGAHTAYPQGAKICPACSSGTSLPVAGAGRGGYGPSQPPPKGVVLADQRVKMGSVTLVLSMITKDWVAQVSDRRLVWLEQDKVVRSDDERNKAVVWCGRLVFGYTGLAELGVERQTDLWLANRLNEIEEAVASGGEVDQGHLLEGLAERCTDYFNGPRIGGIEETLRRHGFVAVGWARFAGERDFSPYIGVVSNFEAGNLPELRTAERQFRIALIRLRRERDFEISAVGHRPSPAELDLLVERVSQTRGDVNGAVELLATKVREVADRVDAVGRGLMINVLPRSAVRAGQAEHMLILSGPQEGTPTFLYVPPHDDLPGVDYGPVSVCGGSVMSGFEARSL